MGKSLKGKELGQGISQRKDGVYQARFVDRFGKRVSVYNTNLIILKDQLNKALEENNNHSNIVDKNITLNKWFDKWLNVYKYKTIRLNTRLRYIQLYEKHIKLVLGDKKLNSITQLQIRNLLKEMDKNGLGFETKNKTKVILYDMFNKAMIDDYVLKNPARGITIKRDEKKETRILTVDEQKDFFECCKGTFYDNLFTVAVSTGLRPGELCCLTIDDLDFEKKQINVNKTLLYQKLECDTCKTFHIDDPKTKTSKRIIPMNRQCELALKKQIIQKNIIERKSAKKPIKGFENLLFTTKFNSPINSQIYSDAINRIVNEINLMKDDLEQLEPFSGHCFRHTFATRCFEIGIQPKTVQIYLGHANLKMTMDLYTHVLEDHQKDEMIKLEDSLDQISMVNEELIEDKYNQIINKNNKIISYTQVAN